MRESERAASPIFLTSHIGKKVQYFMPSAAFPSQVHFLEAGLEVEQLILKSRKYAIDCTLYSAFCVIDKQCN